MGATAWGVGIRGQLRDLPRAAAVRATSRAKSGSRTAFHCLPSTAPAPTQVSASESKPGQTPGPRRPHSTVMLTKVFPGTAAQTEGGSL